MFVQAWRVPTVTGGLQVNWPSPDSRTAGARGSVGEEMYRDLRCRGFTLPLRTSKYVQIWIGPQCANVTLRRGMVDIFTVVVERTLHDGHHLDCSYRCIAIQRAGEILRLRSYVYILSPRPRSPIPSSCTL